MGVTDVPTAPAGGVTATCQDLTDPTGTCSGATTTLVPGQTAIFTGTYTVTQADINHGSIVDHATAQGTTPSSGTVNATSNTVTVTVTQSPALSIVKTATPTTLTQAGQTITYTFDVTNTGNVNLTGVGVTDNPQPPAGALTTGPTCQSLSNPVGTCSGATTPLAPGQGAVFTATYVVTQADVDHGSIVDHATATGTTPTGGTVDGTSNTVTVTATPSPSLTITKSATPTTVTAAGQSVTYTFHVVNTGNVTLTSVGVTDVPTAPAGRVTATCQSLSSPDGTCSGATTTLVPGQIATFTGTYVVTQADINHGSIVDHATTQGTTPSGGTVERHLQHGDGDRDAVTVAHHRQVGHPDHGDDGGPERDLHLHRRQHRQRDPHRRRRHRRPDARPRAGSPPRARACRTRPAPARARPRHWCRARWPRSPAPTS